MARPAPAVRGPAAPAVPGVLLAVLLVGVAGCTAEPGTVPTAQVSSVPPPAAVATVTAPAPVTATVTVTAAPDPVPAPPDPAHAGPDPAPAAPDPAPARPDTAPEPARPDTAPEPADLPPLSPFTAAAERTPSAVALACDAVQEALADGVIRYEVQALSEEGLSGGDRSAAWADIGTAMDDAARAAGGVPGLAAAAAPAMTELTALRDGMSTRPHLDEEDAAPWRVARKELRSWCAGQD